MDFVHKNELQNVPLFYQFFVLLQVIEKTKESYALLEPTLILQNFEDKQSGEEHLN